MSVFVNEVKRYFMNIKQYVNTFNITGLALHMGEVCSLDSSWKREGVCSPFTRLYYIKEGEGFIKTEQGITKLEKGNVYIVPSDHTFSYGCTRLEKIYFHVTVSDAERYDLLSKLGGVRSLPCSKEFMASLEQCFRSDSYTDMLRLRILLSQTVLEFVEKEEEIPVKAHSELVDKAISYIHENMSIKLSASEIARHMFVSESKLRNSFKEEMKMPVGKYIDDMVFMKARQMLAKGDLPITDICTQLGFCDRIYFSGQFKKKFGVPPTEFRKQNREGLE